MPIESVAAILTPSDNPIAIVALAFAIFLFAPLLFNRFGVPGMVGVIILGIIVGPYVLGLIGVSGTIVLLGQVGIVFLMFIAGLDINVNEFLQHPERSLVAGAVFFTIPTVIFFALGSSYLGLGLAAALLFSAVYSSHTLLAYPVVERLGLGVNKAVSIASSSTVVTDTLAFIILAIVGATVTSTSTPAYWLEFFVGIALVFAVIWFFFPAFSRWFLRLLKGEGYTEFMFIMFILFASALLATIAGMAPIIGGFVAGLAMNRVIPNTSTLMNRIKFVGNAIFIPFFLLYVGMLIDPSVLLSGPDVWILTLLIVAVLIASEIASSYILTKRYGFSRSEMMTMASLTTGQAGATLAITVIGNQLGLFSDVIVYSAVFVILIVGIISPILTERYGQRVVAEAQRGKRTERETTRIMVAIERYDESTARLIDLAFALRESKSKDKFVVVAPVEKSYSDQVNELNLKDAERSLDQAKEQAVSAEVAIDVIAELEVSRVAGITRSAADNLIDAIVLAPRRSWIGALSAQSELDQLLPMTQAEVLVADLPRQFNTSKRILVVLASSLFLNPEFSPALGDVKRLSVNTGLPLEFELIQGDEGVFGKVIKGIEPETPFAIHSHRNWRSVLGANAGVLRQDDLVILIGTRMNAMGWSVDVADSAKAIDREQPTGIVLVYVGEKKT